MLFIRSLLYYLGSLISLLVVVFLSIFVYFANHRCRYFVVTRWAIFCLWWFKITINIKVNIQGAENIYKKPCVILSNHQSTWETFAFQDIFPMQTFIIKKDLLWIPFFGWTLSVLKPIKIDRSDKYTAMKKIITQGCHRIANGISVVIFPEGTRMPYKKIAKYQNGAIAIAKKAKVPIQPVYHNAGKFWPKKKFIKKSGTINIVIGKPIYNFDKNASELMAEIENWTKEQLKRVG